MIKLGEGAMRQKGKSSASEQNHTLSGGFKEKLNLCNLKTEHEGKRRTSREQEQKKGKSQTRDMWKRESRLGVVVTKK